MHYKSKRNCTEKSIHEIFSRAFVLAALLLEMAPSLAGMTVVITPDWHETDVQKMPMTVNILSGDELDATGMPDTLSLQYQVPGFVFRTNSVLGQPYLRGVGSSIVTAGAEASVATFKDGIYQPRASNAIQYLYDTERVEVSKGPQGVQLGRNVLGGAVSIISKDPEPFQGAYADVLYGSYNKIQLRGAINRPLTNPNLSLRIAGLVTKRDGYTENRFLGRDLNDEDLYAGRAKLRYKPSEDLDAIFSVEYSSEDSSRGLGNKLDPTIGVNGGILFGGTVPSDPRVVNQNVGGKVDINNHLYTARIKKKLQGAELLSLTGYQDSAMNLAVDLDSTEVDYSSNFAKETSTMISQELRLSSRQNDPLGWVTGIFIAREDAHQALDIRLPLFSVSNRPTGDVTTNSYAVFAQASYQFNELWKSTLGIRESRDKRKLDYKQTVDDPTGALGPAGTSSISLDDSKSWNALTPEFGVEYTPNDTTLIFGTISRGFKAGGYNTTAAQPSFDPEYLLAYELGIKTQPGGSFVKVNGSIFYYDYKDMQVLSLPASAPVGSFPIVDNAASATIKGLDVDILANPAGYLMLSLGLTLLDAQIDEFISVDGNNPTANPNRSGNPLPQAPKSSVNLGAEYSWLLGGGLLKSRLGYRYQSAIYFNAFKDDALRQDGYGLVDASVSFDSLKKSWYLEMFVRNLTDKLYAETILRQDPIVGTLRSWGAPRTFGIRVGYRM